MNETQILPLKRRSLMTENSGTDMQETNNIQSPCLIESFTGKWRNGSTNWTCKKRVTNRSPTELER